MKSAGKSNSIQGKPRIFDVTRFLASRRERGSGCYLSLQRTGHCKTGWKFFSQKSHHYLEEIKSLGFTRTMDELERGKLRVFNQLNLFQFVTGIVVPMISFFGNNKFPINCIFYSQSSCLGEPVCTILEFLFSI